MRRRGLIMNDIKAAFLDRDGTINVEKGYISDPAQIELISGSAAAIRRLNEAGYLVFGLSNQSGVARGFYTVRDVLSINSRVMQMVSEEGGKIEEILFCPHHQQGSVAEYAVTCDCRKPATGMVDKVKSKYTVELTDAVMVGDKIVDLELGRAIGARTALVKTGFGISEMEKIKADGMAEPDVYAKDLAEAVELLLGGGN